jgi:DNA-binding MurR/RpiR family transcriptional regulator
MTVEGFASLREFIRRAVRQLDGAPNDVLEAVENHMRAHHDLLLPAWDELRHRGAAVIHLTTSEYDRSCQLVDEVLQASGRAVPAIWRDPQPVAKAFVDLISQEVKAYQRKPTR